VLNLIGTIKNANANANANTNANNNVVITIMERAQVNEQ
jgi:hypothetical protein